MSVQEHKFSGITSDHRYITDQSIDQSQSACVSACQSFPQGTSEWSLPKSRHAYANANRGRL